MGVGWGRGRGRDRWKRPRRKDSSVHPYCFTGMQIQGPRLHLTVRLYVLWLQARSLFAPAGRRWESGVGAVSTRHSSPVFGTEQSSPIWRGSLVFWTSQVRPRIKEAALSSSHGKMGWKENQRRDLIQGPISFHSLDHDTPGQRLLVRNVSHSWSCHNVSPCQFSPPTWQMRLSLPTVVL